MSIDKFHLGDLPKDHVRNVWQPDTDDLHMNLLVLRSGESIGKHINQLLDIVVTCLRGSGTIHINDGSIQVESGSIVLIPRGSNREIVAGEEGIIYTTVHRKRGGIMPMVNTKKSEQSGGERE